MVCKTTSTRRIRSSLAGFTLTEMIVTMAVASIMFAAVGTFGLYSAKSFASMANYVELDNYSRSALDHLTRDVRQVNRLISNTATNLVFEDADGSTLEYVYSPTDQTLSRVKAGETKVLLTEVDRLNFSIYQRNPVGGSYDVYPTAAADTTKLIDVTWRCTRNIMGAEYNSESVQTSKVVIRKQ